MNNKMKKDGKAQVAEAITETKTNLYYAVDYRIIKHYKGLHEPTDECKNILMISERPIDARRRAFYYAFQLTQGILDGVKPHQAGIGSIHISCINAKTGESVQVSEGKIIEPPDFYFEDREKELEWYEKYGLETDGTTILTVNDEDGKPCRILDYQMVAEPKDSDDLVKINLEIALHTPAIVESPEGKHYMMPKELMNDVSRSFALQVEWNLPAIN